MISCTRTRASSISIWQLSKYDHGEFKPVLFFQVQGINLTNTCLHFLLQKKDRNKREKLIKM